VLREPPSFDLVVATRGRTAELERLLDSLARQSHRRFRVLVVDQNADDRLLPLLAAHDDLEVEHLRSEPGLSRARNAALPRLTADLVAFPDDDCAYPAGLLEQVAAAFDVDPALDGLTGRAVAPDGASAGSWATDGAVLTRENLWNRAVSYAIFLRHDVVERVGPFDERLGLGSGTPWESGEETDYLVRAVDAGARIRYDPALTVEHERRLYDRTLAARDGASLGFILRTHRYGTGTLARMLARPVGGALVSLARLDPAQARVHLATLAGRVRGYRASSWKS
jgi:GT2 family glycosyltransferase